MAEPEQYEQQEPARLRPVDSVGEEVADHGGDLLRMGLEREVAGIVETDCGAWNFAPERPRTCWQKKGSGLSPRRQEAWLASPEIVLECRVERDVALVVAEQVQLNLAGAGA